LFFHTKQFQYNSKPHVAEPQAMGPQMDELALPVEPSLYWTPEQPMQSSAS
jgi:hypothetical protein